MDIEEIDPYDDVRLAEVFEVMVSSADREYGCAWTWREFSASARLPGPWTEQAVLLVRDEGAEPLAAASIELPQRDNIDQAWCDIWVRPGHGAAGDALVERLTAEVKHRGRRTMLADAVFDAHGSSAVFDAHGSSSDLRELLERHGFVLALANAHRVLDLPTDRRLLTRIEAEAAPHHRDYRLVSWAGPCPDAWVEGYADLRARMISESPNGDLETTDEAFDADRVRHEERRFEAQDRTSYTTVAVYAGNLLAGHSQLIVPGTDEVNAFQWDTLVLPEHRGHRLGLALKARNLGQARDALVPRRRLHTWNAVGNEPMIAVNERFGYRFVEYDGEFQLRL